MAYVPTTWNTGDTITADKLNHLESGVAANDAAVTSAANGASAANSAAEAAQQTAQTAQQTAQTAQSAAQQAKSAAETAQETAEAAQAAIPKAASTDTAGTVKQIANIAQLSAAPTQADFNGLLTALQNAGIMASAD